MTAFNLGPLALPLAMLPWLAGVLVAWGTAAWRRRDPFSVDEEVSRFCDDQGRISE